MTNQIFKALRTTVKEFGSREPLDILEAMNVIVYYHPLNGAARGFTFWHEGNPIVCIEETLSASERRKTAAHELGHIVLDHSKVNAFTSDPQLVRKNEESADLFADLLLDRRLSI